MNDNSLQTSSRTFLDSVKVKSALDILNSQNKSLVRISAEVGEKAVKAMLYILISDCLDFFNIGKSMSANQIMQTAVLILEDYSVYKIDYFVLCFNRAKKGQYGKVYDRIDGQIIFEWLAQFDYEYSAEIEAERRNESKRIEKQLQAPIEEESLTRMPDWFADSIKKMNEPKPLEQKPINLTDDQILINGFIQEFNKIHLEGEHQEGKRFIKFKGKMADVTEYIELRLQD